MITQIARRTETAANELLSAVDGGDASCDELREVLRVTRCVAAAIASVQTTSAELIAARERHGDGGAEVLAVSAGLSQSEAHSQVKVAQAVRKVPELRDAVQSGEVPQANARRLADAITKVGSAAVAGNAELLQQASSMRPEQFKHSANRWVTAQQADKGACEHARQRAKRYLKFYDTQDGMIALHGEFDKITGTRISNRIRHLAKQLFNNDQRLPKDQRREFAQCMADALDHHTTSRGVSSNKRSVSGVSSEKAATTPNSSIGDDLGGGTSRNETAVTDTRAKRAVSAKGNGTVSANRTSNLDNTTQNKDNNNDGNATNSNAEDTTPGDMTSLQSADRFEGCASNSNDGCATTSDGGDSAHDTTASNNDASTAADDVQPDSAGGGGWVADITLVAHVDDTTGELIAELSDGSRLPKAVLEELSCNARWTGLVYDRCGDAIWRSRSRRTVTDTQWQTLLTTYRGCFHCGAPPQICQAHHIIPYSQGGATSVKNMVMVCWNCHHRIHHHNWQIHEHPDGSHTLHPSNNPSTQPRYGPAHADDHPPGLDAAA